MLRRQVLVRVLAGAVLVSGAWGQDVVTAGEAKALRDRPAAAAAEKPEPEAKPDLVEALKGFKGFLVGELVKTGDEGIVLLVRAVTLVEGSQAANPGVLLGLEAPVQFATEKDDEGNDRPDPGLVKTAKRLQQMPPVAFGGLGGNAVVVMDMGQPGQQAAAVTGTAHLRSMRINGAEIELGGDPEQEEPDRKPKGPTITARVRADEDGKLVMDRVMPGSTPGHTWAAMPRLRFAGPDEPDDALLGLHAHQQALKAQLKALARQQAVLKKQAAREDGVPEEHAARLHEHQARIHAQLDAVQKQMAMLRDAAARRKQMVAEQKRRKAEAARQKPPARKPDGTDF